MEVDIIPSILNRIAEQKSSIAQFLAGGAAKNYEEYCRMVGEHSALSKLEGEIKDIEQRFIES
jgi:hypothetical protein